MQELFSNLNNLDKDSIFWFCALAGTGTFIIQFLLTLFGVGESGDEGSSESDAGQFQWLSKQALTGFLMLFGWVGLTCRKEFDLSATLTIAFALSGGVASILITGFLFKAARKLRSSGTVFRIEDALGKEAMIYQRIPSGGMGRVTVSLHNFTHEIDAIALQSEELPSFTPVKIIKIADDKTVIVEPVTTN